MRRILLSVVSLFLLVGPALPAHAQTIEWVNQFGSPGSDIAWGVVSTSHGIYVSGFTEGALPGQTSAGGVDGFLRLVDATGAEVWTVQFGTPRDDLTFAVAADATGLYIMGQTAGSAGQAEIGKRDGFLIKFDFDGSELWTRQFGTTEADAPSYVIVDGTGVYVVGQTHGAFPGETHRGGGDVFLTRFDTDGNQDWTTQFGSRRDEFGYAAEFGPGGIYVNGFTLGRLPGQRSRGDLDAFVALVDGTGTRLWLRQFGTPLFDLGLGLATDQSAVYVSGTTSGAFRGERDRNKNDAFVRAFTREGSVLWTEQFGSGGDDACQVLVRATDELLCGGTTSGTFDGQTSAGDYDAVVTSLDPSSGGLGWTLQFGTRRSDGVLWATVDGSTLYVVGHTEGTLPDQDRSGEDDAFVAAIDTRQQG